MQGEVKEKNKETSFESLDILAERWKNGTFSEILDDWKWIFSYSARYKGAIIFYTLLGILRTSLGLIGSVAGKYLINNYIPMAGMVIAFKKLNYFVEQHPHHIPMLFMLDVINGFKTIFPIPLGQGATFEPELSEKCAAVAAKEAAVSGLHVTFAPMTDLVRDARWGRVMESTGEDPYLNSLFCAGMVRGFQGDDLKEPYSSTSTT